ncbi:hypothetical protein HELRODRAFT_106726 [Helobdella robusta]|uniref:Cytokine-like nuclear factor N-PAC n=1 Tax=Helobdella robusta TaxID=6412 RepID=T1EE43_HELRO|nr:hypothetical protein HELRODRAFT_106726 [Helobdella robusta]ESO02559.1 hypothetical protein HELRODRAFT_106726 [Helobdella robusta]
MESKFKLGDIVWAKMKGFPPWPGKVCHPMPDVKKPADKRPKQFIFFFGSENYAYVLEETIWPFTKFKELYKTPSRMLRGFQEAVEIAEKLDSLRDWAEPPDVSPSDEAEKLQQAASFTKKRLLDSGPSTSSSSNKKQKDSFEFNDSNENDDSFEGPSSKRSSMQYANDDYYAPEGYMPDILPPLNDSISSRNIIATPMRIGFLGLGMIGRGVVDNLLRSGHEVTVWNRTTSKCYEFTKDGALKGSTPAEVVQLCDITFSCVSDPAALKDLVFANCGVLQGISPGKGYVDMSTVDVETIKDVQEAVVSKGGRFLEAPVIGNRMLARAGQLVVLAAGDKALYDDCYSCFQAISKHKFHLGEVGSATKMKLVLTLIFGSALSGLAECLALSTKLGLDNTEVMKIISHSSISSIFIHEKGIDMIKNRIAEPNCKLNVMQKDMKLAINLSDTVDQPLPVCAAVNELFKKAKAKGYSEDDIASLYRAADL